MLWEDNGEHASFGENAFDFDHAVMRFDDMLTNGEAQACSARCRTRAIFIDPIKPLEETRQVLGEDTDPGIVNLDGDGVGIWGIVIEHEPHNALAIGIFDGVVDEVYHDLFETFFVTENLNFVMGQYIAAEVKLDLLLHSDRTHFGNEVAQKRLDIEESKAHSHLA